MLPTVRRSSRIRPPRRSLVSSFVGASGTGATGGADNANVVDYDKSWAILSSAIKQIQNKNVSNLSYEQLYRKAYVLVLRKFGAKLYENVSELIKNHLLQRREILLKENSGLESPEDFLKAILLEWTEHLQSMKFISDVLMYLNRVYVKEHKRLLIYDLGIQLFKENVVKYNDDEVGKKLIDISISEITKSRSGQVITTKMYISKVVNMLELLEESVHINDGHSSSGENFYLKHFEPQFIAYSVNFFRQLCHKYIADASLLGTTYLHEINDFIKEEETRLSTFLPMSTFPKIIDLMNNILIKDKIDDIMCLPEEQQGLSFWMGQPCEDLFQDENIATTATKSYHLEELVILYELVGRIDPERDLLKKRLKELVVKEGLAIPVAIKEQLDSSLSGKKTSTSSAPFALSMISKILKYQQNLSLVLKECFANDFGLEQGVTIAMRDFINNASNKNKKQIGQDKANVTIPSSAELLSIYMDHYIKLFTKLNSSKVGATTTSKDLDLSVDEFMERSISFLRYIKDKDAFEAHYAAHFAKRFLNAKANGASIEIGSGKVDVEELILSKLGEEMGSSSLEKVLKMNRDIKLSRDMTVDWKKHNNTNGLQGNIELELKICNVADWPKSLSKDYTKFSSENFTWPSQLRSTLNDFEEYWLTGKKNDNKSLYWSPRFGSIDLRITYPSKLYEINLSPYAGIIMLLFAPQSSNDDGSPVLAFEEMRELKYEEIRELTKIPEADLKRQLQSIAVAPRLRLLIKTPMGKEVNEGDVFKLNSNFKAPSMKVKILTVSATSSGSTGPLSSKNGGGRKKTAQEEELEEVNANISESRNFEINAAIVRIMKSRQTLDHNELISELIRQLTNRFLPLTIQIKRQIEDLIQKEYLKRDDENRSLYHYVA